MTNIYGTEPTPALLDIAENVAESLRVTGAEGAADLVGELGARLADCLTTQALAAEGIGQRAPIALLLLGKITDETVFSGIDAAQQLTLNGYIVLEHDPPLGLDAEDETSMHALLLQKIEMADVVNIVNVGGIDETLLPFIDHAENHSKPVQYTNPND